MSPPYSGSPLSAQQFIGSRVRRRELFGKILWSKFLYNAVVPLHLLKLLLPLSELCRTIDLNLSLQRQDVYLLQTPNCLIIGKIRDILIQATVIIPW